MNNHTTLYEVMQNIVGTASRDISVEGIFFKLKRKRKKREEEQSLDYKLTKNYLLIAGYIPVKTYIPL